MEPMLCRRLIATENVVSNPFVSFCVVNRTEFSITQQTCMTEVVDIPLEILFDVDLAFKGGVVTDDPGVIQVKNGGSLTFRYKIWIRKIHVKTF